MNTIIICPYCKEDIPIIRKIAIGHEIIEKVYCPHCKRSMDIEFDTVSNLPHLLAYSEKTGIKLKKSEEGKKIKTFEIRYHENSIDALTNLWYKEEFVKCIPCAKCARFIYLNQEKRKKEIFGLFCDTCAWQTKFRYSNEFLSELYDAEQASRETENHEKQQDQEEKKMATIKSTIIGFVLQDGETYKLYNPQTNQLASLSATEFHSMCLGEFPYRKIRANTLCNGEVVETLDNKIYYVSDASKNELFDFITGKIERSAIVTNLMVNTNCYIKYVPVLKKYCTFADIAAGNIDPRIAKMIEIISNDIQTGDTSTTNNVIAKMVRFLSDPNYTELLDKEVLTDMVMADPQAFMIMGQMSTMRLADSIITGKGVPLSLQMPNQETVNTTELDISQKLENEDEATYQQRLTELMEEAVNSHDYVTAGKYQKILNSI